MESQSPGVSSARFAPPTPPPPSPQISYGDPPEEAVTPQVASRILRQARREKSAWFKKWLADAMVPDQPNGNGPNR
jgi:hypothetical protein